MGSYLYYAIYDDWRDNDLENEAPAEIIKFVNYQSWDKMNDLFTEYQNGGTPITWDTIEINNKVVSRQINYETVELFCDWLHVYHGIKAEPIEYCRAHKRDK